MHAIVEQLVALIEKNGWQSGFHAAIKKAQSHDVHSIKGIQSLGDYLTWIDALVTWAPRERGDTRFIYQRLAEFYFFLDQEPVKGLQSPIRPGEGIQTLTPLSAWIKEYARAWGSYLDTTESAKEVDSFRTNPMFNWDEYMPPPSGYFTFNQFFARHVKPGMRPIAGLCDDNALVSPADSMFVGWWQISEQSKIYVERNTLDVLNI